MTSDPSERPGPSLTDEGPRFAATLVLKALPRFSGNALMAEVGKLLEGTDVVTTLESELAGLDEGQQGARVWNRAKTPPHIGLTIDGITLLVDGSDRPGFSAPELAELDFGLWPEGRARIARARAHVAITEDRVAHGASLDQNYDRAAAMTVVAAAVAKLAEASAIVWHRSRRAVPATQLASLVAELAKGEAPVPLWLSCPVRPEGARGAATYGLFPLLGAEIEVVSPDLPAATAIGVALDLASEILRAGEPPEDGAVMGYDDTTDFSVELRAGGDDGAPPLVVLTHVTQSAEQNPAAGAA